MATFNNGESGLSVRNKLNTIINKVEGVSTIDNDINVDGVNLSPIASTIADTAVDIFVYDTRKDSDGGAWRKRTQHTSWYNETLNTATRGSRKEFPAVAVIVAESTQVTIYDGDDPDLPMWMVFNTGGSANSALGQFTRTSTSALNGVLTTTSSQAAAGGQLSIIQFIDESIYSRRSTGGTQRGKYLGNISTRNDDSGWDLSTDQSIVDQYCNDVAMTVLPNAPIDAATGLPAVTIACATDGGVSVIKDDGTVVDYAPTSSSFEAITVGFTENGDVFGSNWFASTVDEKAYIFPLLSSDGSMSVDAVEAFAWSTTGEDMFWGGINSGTTSRVSYGNTNVFGDEVVAGQRYSVEQLVRKKQYQNLLNYTSTSYNTGWMNGDIKLATLSDTDDTNVTGSELVTNGTFDTDTSGWTAVNAVVSWDASGYLVVDDTANAGSDSRAYQDITTVVGETYVLSFDKISTTSAFWFGIGNASNISSVYYSGSLGATTGSHSQTFVATATTTRISMITSGTGVTKYDNISVRLAEEDRSVNGNGLQVFGTVTKSAVATGADLVGYSFNGSNYFYQPHNSDFDVGTGDFCYMVWFEGGSTGDHIFERFTLSLGSEDRQRVFLNSSGYLNVAFDGYTTYTGSTDYTNSPWKLLTVVRNSSGLHTYLDGVLLNSASASAHNYNIAHALVIGNRYASGAASSYSWAGNLALFRFSATAPSPEQIKKIYEDEKVLFQEGAQATLYGSSDAVTALAYDDSTELLHVGTSAGRSVFQGLRRVDNTTTAVGAAISASNGLVADE